jgi:hypothetical protein
MWDLWVNEKENKKLQRYIYAQEEVINGILKRLREIEQQNNK